MPATTLRRTPRRARLLALPAAALLALGALTACGGSDGGGGDDGPSAAERLETARTTLAEAKGVTISLSTSKIPQGSNGILDATGVGTDAPAFEGKISAVLDGLSADVPVVAVDGKVYVSLFSAPYTAIDPGDFGAPDPATLFGPDGGLVALLTDVKGLEAGDDVRDGKEVLSSLTGTIDGAKVKTIFPGSDTTSFKATFTLNDDDQIVKALVKGPFYKGEKDLTYTIELSKYGTTKDIKKP